jgi:hypothetical protein
MTANQPTDDAGRLRGRMTLEQAKEWTARVQTGAFYTDGRTVAQVMRVHALGHIQLQDARSGDWVGVGIRAFREHWWRVR